MAFTGFDNKNVEVQQSCNKNPFIEVEALISLIKDRILNARSNDLN